MIEIRVCPVPGTSTVHRECIESFTLYEYWYNSTTVLSTTLLVPKTEQSGFWTHREVYCRTRTRQARSRHLFARMGASGKFRTK